MVPSVDNGLTFQATLQNNPFPDGILQPTGASGASTHSWDVPSRIFNPNNLHSYSTAGISTCSASFRSAC